MVFLSPPETAYAHLFITVRDVNDNAPQFDYPFYIFGEHYTAVTARSSVLGHTAKCMQNWIVVYTSTWYV